MTPHMCLLLAGIELFRGIRQPRWFLSYTQMKGKVINLSPYYVFNNSNPTLRIR